MKTILLILTAITLNANCEYYVNEYNHSKIRFETMQEVKAPYEVTNNERKRIMYYLKNAEVHCEKKEYYKTLIKMYENN